MEKRREIQVMERGSLPVTSPILVGAEGNCRDDAWYRCSGELRQPGGQEAAGVAGAATHQGQRRHPDELDAQCSIRHVSRRHRRRKPGLQRVHLFVQSNKQFSSESITGTHDWRYLAVEFRSGDLTEVDISLRLGGNSSVVTGSAWFDDLVLIELPELPPPVKHEAKDKSGKTGG